MKIHPDQIESIRQQDQQTRTAKADQGQAFGAFLEAELSQEGTASNVSAASLPGLTVVNPMLQMQSVQGTEAASMSEEAMVQKVDELLGKVEEYAAQLESGATEGSLKEAWGTLSDISDEVAGLKEQAVANPGLSALVNELDVLSTTERIKFNRGDYLS